MQLEFTGRRALILGGTCDMAVALAVIMIESGIFPVMTYHDKKGRDHIRKTLEAFEEKFQTAYLTLEKRNMLDCLFSGEAADIDYLVDFAQSDYECLVAAANDYEFERYFAQNVAFRADILKRAARVMLKRKRGRLVFASSAAAARANPGQGFYAAAKLSSEQLYKSIGIELGSRGITSVSLRLGYVDAGRGNRYLQERGVEFLNRIPIGRALDVTEVAQTIMFLLSEAARGLNATEIIMDGGLTQVK